MHLSTPATLFSCLVALFLAHAEANHRPKEVFNLIFNEEEWWEIAVSHLNVLRQHLANLPPLKYDVEMAKKGEWSKTHKKFFKEPIIIRNQSICKSKDGSRVVGGFREWFGGNVCVCYGERAS